MREDQLGKDENILVSYDRDIDEMMISVDCNRGVALDYLSRGDAKKLITILQEYIDNDPNEEPDEDDHMANPEKITIIDDAAEVFESKMGGLSGAKVSSASYMYHRELKKMQGKTFEVIEINIHSDPITYVVMSGDIRVGIPPSLVKEES